MESTKEKQDNAIRYYDKFSKVYDWISSDSYYRKPRMYAIEKLDLKPKQAILNLPCGTGQNFKYFQTQLNDTGKIIGIDLSEGMLSQANAKIRSNGWNNVRTYRGDATKIEEQWINSNVEEHLKFDSIFCDLGLSGFPDWEKIIDNLISILKPNGKLVIMDWYIDKASVRGKFIKWVGKGEVNRPIYQFMEKRVANFELVDTFKKGDMFVASGTKK